MKQEIRNRQRNLFETRTPLPPLRLDRRDELLVLIQALLLETMAPATMSTAAVENGHDQDHA